MYTGGRELQISMGREFAKELLDDFLIKIKLGQSITGHTLSKMIEC